MTTAPQDTRLYDEDFYGAHFEGFGEVWNAFFGNSAQFEKYLPDAVAKAEKKTNGKIVRFPGEELMIDYAVYRESPDLACGLLFARRPEAMESQLYAAFPLFEGKPNPLTVKDVRTWHNGAEGVVSATRANGGTPITFYDPHYFKERWDLRPKSEHRIHLGALALQIAPAEREVYSLEEGEAYDAALQKFLRDNPEKSRKDFSPPRATTEGGRMLFPTDYVGEWLYQFPVESVTKTALFGTKFLKIAGTFAGDPGKELRGYLYASEHVLGKYQPRPGDDIQGVLWMTGYASDAEHLAATDPAGENQ
jgi:hypothetical protein